MAVYTISLAENFYGNYALDAQPDFERLDEVFNMPVVSELLSSEVKYGALASDTLGMSYAFVIDAYRTALAESGMGITTGAVSAFITSPLLAESVLIQDAPDIATLIQIAETVGLVDAATSVRALELVESLGLADVLTDKAIQGLTVLERVLLVETVTRFLSGVVSDTFSLTDALAQVRLTTGAVEDAVGTSDTLASMLVLRIGLNDALNISDAQLLKLLFRDHVSEIVDLAAMEVGPNGSVTTWSVNAVTGAVSRYDNFEFNSFAHFGQMHIAADSEGLYELNSSNDEGSAIIARVRSGLAQMAGSRFTIVRDAYIGMRSNGSFVLRVITGEGDTYNYSFHSESMKTTRVPLGKGMRTRYVAFELISTGDDFDLDAVEFIPLSSTRRV